MHFREVFFLPLALRRTVGRISGVKDSLFLFSGSHRQTGTSPTTGHVHFSNAEEADSSIINSDDFLRGWDKNLSLGNLDSLLLLRGGE